MRRLLPAIILALAFVVPAFAQDADIDHPDLTGTWVLNIAKSKFNKHVKPSPNVDITCGVYAAEIDESIDGKRHVFEYTPDGQAYLVERVPGGQIMSKAYWKKGSLVTELWGVQTTPGEAGRSAATMLHQTQRWSLSIDGKVLTREIDGGKEVLVYDLQQDDSADCEVPNFSGTWKLNLAKSKLRHNLPDWSTIEIVCTDTTIHAHFAKGDVDAAESYTADGAEHLLKNEQGWTLYTKAEWQGSTLVTDWRTFAPTGTVVVDAWDEMPHVQHWKLSQNGRELVRALEDPLRTLVYDKQ